MIVLCIAAAAFLSAAPAITTGPPKLEADNVAAGEGPSWDREGFLYFTGSNRISRRDTNGKVEIFREPAGGANGTLIDRQGRLVICEATTRRVIRLEPDGRITVLADQYQGSRFNSPNDLSIDSKGRLYFTDPRYGKRDSMEMRDSQKHLAEGVYRIDAPGKAVRILAGEVERPNGILVSPDDRYLYIADNNNTVGGARKLWRFDLNADGSVATQSKKLLFDWHTARGPDGLKMDVEGRLYVAAGLTKPNPPHETADEFKGGVYILSDAGQLLEFVPIPKDEVTNCAFGGADLKTLFVTAGGSLWSVPVKTPGRITAGRSERSMAEWVIRQRGRVMLNGDRRPLATITELPSGPFRVTGVDLMGTTVEPEQLEYISGLTHVTELYLPGASWTPGAGSRLDANDALRHLAGMKKLERLQFSLHFLPYFNVGDAAFAHIRGLTQLRDLRCAQCRLRADGLAPFTNLRSLDLSHSTFGDAAMPSLSGMRNLQRLYLRDTMVTDEGLKHIAELHKLEELDLYGAKITDRGVALLSNLKSLRKLNLLGSPVSDDSVRVIAQMPALQELNLYRSRITNSGLMELARLKELRLLDVRYSRVTSAGVDSFRAALPSCDLEFAGVATTASTTPRAEPAGEEPAAILRWINDRGGRVELAGGTVTAVSLTGVAIGDSHLAYLGRLTTIEKLDLSGTEVGDAGLKHIGRLSGLKELDLSGTTVSDRGLNSLADLRQLRTLRLGSTGIEGTGLQAITGLPLEDLDLSSSPVTDSAMIAIAQISTLTRLSLSGSDVTNAGIPPLRRLSKLTALNLNSTDIGGEALRIIGELTSLRELSLRFCRFTDKDLAHLRGLVQLERLDLARTRAASEALASAALMRKLKVLQLDYTPTTTKTLAALKGHPTLEELSLDSTDVDDAATDILVSLSNLRTLNLYHTLLSEAAVTHIRAALPKCRILWDRDSTLPNRRKT